jgi:hypothetical protein
LFEGYKPIKPTTEETPAAMTKHTTFAKGSSSVIAAPSRRQVLLPALIFCLLVLLMQAFLGAGLDLSMVLLFPLGLVCTYLLLKYPEVSLGLFLTAGGVKMHPRLTSLGLPDLTIVFAGLVALSCVLRLAAKNERLRLPLAFALYIPMAVMVPVSLIYTVDFAEGLDKAGRFLLLNGLAIVAPFIALNSKAAFRRFFYVLLIVGLLEVITAIVDPQTAERLSSPGGLVLHLGYYAATGIIVLIFLGLPRASFLRRLPFYALFPLLFYGLVGSGVRRSLIGVLICAALAILLYPKLILDFVVLGLAAFVIVSAAPIPAFSVDYLSTLVNLSPGELYGGRQHLLDLGLAAGMGHPFLGVGIGAFRFFTPNPAEYDYPHVLLVEIFCEVGIFAAVSILLLQLYTLYRIFRNAFSPGTAFRTEMLLALAFLVIGLVDSSVSGDINNIRPMWLAMSLPFVVMKMQERNG